MKRVISLFATLVLAFSSQAFAKSSEGQRIAFKSSEVNEIQKIVHDYIVNNPQVLVEASATLQQQQQEKQAMEEKKAREMIAKNAKAIFHDPEAPVAGNSKGEVQMAEFFDYQCAYCKRVAPMVDKLITSNKNLKVVFKEYPIFSGNSDYAAKAALAAQKQGKYLAMHDALMKAPLPLSEDSILKTAKSIGLDIGKLKEDIKSDAIVNEVKENQELGAKIGIRYTPTFIITRHDKESHADDIVYIAGAADENVLRKILEMVEKGERVNA